MSKSDIKKLARGNTTQIPKKGDACSIFYTKCFRFPRTGDIANRIPNSYSTIMFPTACIKPE